MKYAGIANNAFQCIDDASYFLFICGAIMRHGQNMYA
jgi:hypothetical protein|tara:strand:+ start:387 stop:497 length:111 start_codon:yes stop_codon:yes gene_type:complete